MAGSSVELRELLGPLLPFKDDDGEQDDYVGDVEEDEEVFVDAEELCSGGVKAGSLPGRLRVSIPDENTQENCSVYGRFPITGPWWRVKVHVVKPVGSKSYQVQGFPSYFLQSDMSPPNQENICSLFLKECGITSEIINKFLTWVNEVSSYHDLNFENLREKLRTFYRENEKKNQRRSAQNEQEVSMDSEQSLPLENKTPFVNVMIALQFPKIMEFLPVLLPRHFKRIIHSSSKGVLEEIENILTTCPWKLGFSKITYRDLKLLRCEASWVAFSQCTPLLELMTDLEKNALNIYSKLKQICREHGHTYVEQAYFTSELLKPMSPFEAWNSLKFLKNISVVTFEKDRLFLYDLYQAERGIASSICSLMNKPPWHIKVDVKKVLSSIGTTKPKDSAGNGMWEESKLDEAGLEDAVDILDLQESDDRIWDNGGDEMVAGTNGAVLDQDQVAALEMVCSNAVTVISGKGGCGKTTIVSHLFKHVEQLEAREVKQACEDFEQDQNVPEEWLTFTEKSHLEVDKAIDVLLTAPTGKAASLLREKTGLPAYTLCQVNYSFYLWDKNQGNSNLPWKFSSVRVLVVDEGSLVSVGIFKSVLKLLCEHSKLSKLIILGDIRQLPSIEPGNMLQDLFETFKSRQCAIELKTNHRAESQLIVDNATRISGRHFPKFDAEVNISEHPTLPVSLQDKSFIFIRLPEENDSSQTSQSDHQSSLYSAVKTLLQEKDFQSAEKSQFIAFRRQDCDLINDCCCKHYTGHLTKDHQRRLIFRIGDKICCTRNAYLSDLLPKSTFGSQQGSDLEASGEVFRATPGDLAKSKHDFESGIRLCNGEVFFITNDITDVTFGEKRYLTIDNKAGLEVTVDFRKLRQFCHIKHAWAKTIHTFQGSEEDTVVYVVGKAGRQHWQHVYTAVTRGRRRVYVIAEESQLQRAILKASAPRKTRLKHFLQNHLSTSHAPAADCPSQWTSSGDSGGPSTLPSKSPLGGVPNIPDPRSITSSEESAFGAGWRLPSLEDGDADEDLAQARGSKRTGGGFPPVDESPSKYRLVEDSSPQVSSRFQNLRLNNLTPRQLFKHTDNQETQ